MQKKTFVGFIGGSGLYELSGLQKIQEIAVDTPFGAPSDVIITGELDGKSLAFLPRHGRGHLLTPSEVNYRANVFALKKIGVTHIVSISAVGSLQEDLPPGSVVIPQQLLDRTSLRQRSFFGNGAVGHIEFAEPFCNELQSQIVTACQRMDIKFKWGGTCVVVEGPRFSSKAESKNFQQMGCSIIGMTAMPEAALAREAEIPYAILALVTDYDCWRDNTEPVTADHVVAILKRNTEVSKQIIKEIALSMHTHSNNPIFNAAQHALMTPPHLIPEATRRNLELLYGKYWNI